MTRIRDAVSDAVDRRIPEGEGGESSPPPASGWTPERKAAQSARMRALRDQGRPIGRPRKAKQETTPPPEPEPPSPGEIQAYALVGKTVWSLAGPMLHLHALDSEQALRLGEALAPLGKKYLPFLDKWAEEANAAIVILALYQETHIPKERQSHESLSSPRSREESSPHGDGNLGIHGEGVSQERGGEPSYPG